jgi:hypothetical protein
MAVDRQRRRPQKAIESIQEGQVNQMNLRMSIDGVVIATATLDVSRSAEDFATLLAAEVASERLRSNRKDCRPAEATDNSGRA